MCPGRLLRAADRPGFGLAVLSVLVIGALLVGCDLTQGQDQQTPTNIPPIVETLRTFVLDFARQVAAAFLL